MGGSPRYCRNLSASTDRDTPTSWARLAIVQRYCGARCMWASAAPTFGSRAPAGHPVCCCGISAMYRRSVSTKRASDNLARTASLPARLAPASVAANLMELSSHCPSWSFRILTLHTIQGNARMIDQFFEFQTYGTSTSTKLPPQPAT